jgi:hypothetical protein
MANEQIDSKFWFQVARKEIPLSKVPVQIAKKALDFLNHVQSPNQLLLIAPLLGEEDRGLAHAKSIIDKRKQPFTSLEQVWEVEGLGPARFVEIVRSIADTDKVTIPDLGQNTSGPGSPVFSASETELQFHYEVLAEGPMKGLQGETAARYCTACSTTAANFNSELNAWETQVQITGLILDGEDKNIKYSIQMDLRMQPYDWMHPLDEKANQFQFPAKMQLNNSMIIDTEIKPTGQRMTLVSRDVPCQVGRVTNWPPFLMTLHTQDKVVYYNQAVPLDSPILRILDATTFLFGPDFFFSVRTDVTRYRYIAPSGDRGLPAVELEWQPKLGGKGRIHHYHVYRSPNPDLGKGSWVKISGPVMGGVFIDPNPPQGPNYYRVVPVMQDIFAHDYEGFPGQICRVEPGVSVFRR